MAKPTVAVAALIVGVGLYGALTSAKCHERATYHLHQARALTQTLHNLGTLTENPHLDRYRETHYRTYPRLHKLRLHWLWTGLHLAITTYGAALTLIILTK